MNINITLRCLYSVFMGAIIVTMFSGLLHLYGETQETLVEITSQALKFPENEQDLRERAARLADNGEFFNNIAPAAGN